MTRNDEIRRLLDTLLATRTDAVSPYMRDRAREDAAMRLAYDCDELLGSIVPTLLEENEEQARRIAELETERDGVRLVNGLQDAALEDANDERIRQNQRIARLERALLEVQDCDEDGWRAHDDGRGRGEG